MKNCTARTERRTEATTNATGPPHTASACISARVSLYNVYAIIRMAVEYEVSYRMGYMRFVGAGVWGGKLTRGKQIKRKTRP